MKKAANLILALTIYLLSGSVSHAKITQTQEGIFVQDVTTKELVELFEKHNYKDYIYMPEWKYPPIFLKNIPKDFDKLENKSERNRIFLMILSPLVLKVNENILKEREELLKIAENFNKNKTFSESEEKFLEEKAKKYDVFTRFTGLRRYNYILSHLLTKVDAVPPSILMAIAAIESDWGTSRPTLKANSLYKEKLWFTDEGLKPEDEEAKKDDFTYKIFPSLYDSIYSHALRINSGINYELFRHERAFLRDRGSPIFGKNLAGSMTFDSPLENFSGLLDYTITFYELINLDESSLMPDLPSLKK